MTLDTAPPAGALAPGLVTELEAGPPLVSASRLSKRWSKALPLVLDDVSLALPPGCVIGISGHNGVGKTTLLRILAGLIEPDSGEVRIAGLHPGRSRRRFQRHVAYVPATNTGLYARLTVRQNLELERKLALLDPDGGQTVDRAIEQSALEHLASRRTDRLSMGQRQRVRLAIAAMRDPQVLLLDEPTNSLDEAGAAFLIDLVERRSESGGVVLWCAPLLTEPLPNLDAVASLRAGRLEWDR